MNYLVFAFCLLFAVSSCTNFKDESVTYGGVTATVDKLEFSSSASERSLVVTSGEEWNISQIPDWLKVKSINRSGYSWNVIILAEANNGYDRSGTLTFRSSSSTASIAVSQDGKKGTGQDHEWVDLGLSVKWATCNVGASSPSDYGSYFAWGETTTKNEYTWENYRFRVTGDSWDNVTFSKYNTDNARGTVDNKKRLDMSDDAARANWGGSWRMPTDAEWTELREKCTWTWTTQGGKNGHKVTSKTNGNSIFLPAAGYRLGYSLGDAGFLGRYWSSSLGTSGPYYAWDVGFYSSDVSRNYIYRSYGFSVRPVTE